MKDKLSDILLSWYGEIIWKESYNKREINPELLKELEDLFEEELADLFLAEMGRLFVSYKSEIASLQKNIAQFNERYKEREEEITELKQQLDACRKELNDTDSLLDGMSKMGHI